MIENDTGYNFCVCYFVRCEINRENNQIYGIKISSLNDYRISVNSTRFIIMVGESPTPPHPGDDLIKAND